MRWRPGAAAVALALAGCGSSQAATSTSQVPDSPGPCGPAATVLAHDAVARIYRQGRTVYGCSVRSGHSFRLGSTGFCNGSDRIGPITLAGVTAAYGIERCGVDTGATQVLVRRLTDGAVRHTGPATSRVPGAESFQAVGSIVVKPDGAVAWIGQAQSIVGHRALIEVHRIDSRGAAELDSGTGIAVESLRLHGSQLSWTHSRSERSATLS